MGATVRIFTPMRNMVFNSWSNARLRKCVNYVQQRVMEIRNHGLIAQQLQTQVNGIPQLPGLTPGFQPQLAQGTTQQPAQTQQAYTPMNPYTKTPLLSRRRRFPSFY
jgi:hypothetical protein